MIPQRVHTMRGPNDGTGRVSGQLSALRIGRWWHSEHDTSIDRTPFGNPALFLQRSNQPDESAYDADSERGP
jgi:hypothetical protein